MAPCTRTCRPPGHGECHCSACHRTFADLDSFDRHTAARGRCLNATFLAAAGITERCGLWATVSAHAARNEARTVHQSPPEPDQLALF